ncbi:RING-type E3 ubiquitin transferase [Melia azedarach]|uniref:RING-type E3 ubiquitin transferase n=1 Tax=Melia azedarach TaxID=155640 RepID=A0ACC1XV88_MELAZ|nr:RING-type E3 ubiquitin transferase [Melia azedarach]
MSIPHLFRCPISLDLFRDPVTLCTGQTYDRSSIEKWLAAGNLTCPVTMQKLHDPTFVPNHTLRHLISQWLQIGDHHHHQQQQIDPGNITTIDSFSALKHTLQSQESTIQTKLQIVQKILAVLRESPPSNSFLHQLGFLPLLLEQLFGKAEAKFPQDYIKFVEEALSCVDKLLSVGQLESLNMLNEESKMESFIVLFQHGTSLVKKNLCHLVEVISSSQETKSLCSELGKHKKLLHEIIFLISHNPEASDAGIKALSALCSSESNCKNLVQEGAIKALISYISNAERREKKLAAIAMARIEQLLSVESAKEELINHPNGIYALVKMIFRVSDHEGSENAMNSLMIICSESLQAREEAICSGILTQLLLLLQSQCSNRTKTKARMLLKLLRSKWAEEQNHHHG